MCQKPFVPIQKGRSIANELQFVVIPVSPIKKLEKSSKTFDSRDLKSFEFFGPCFPLRNQRFFSFLNPVNRNYHLAWLSRSFWMDRLFTFVANKLQFVVWRRWWEDDIKKLWAITANLWVSLVFCCGNSAAVVVFFEMTLLFDFNFNFIAVVAWFWCLCDKCSENSFDDWECYLRQLY
jgi:hypothetical protein